MKSNRILLLILLAIIIVFGAVDGYLYTANNAETKNQTQLKDTIAKDQVTINKGITQKATLDKNAADIADQLTKAKASLAGIHFRPAIESLEYDRILYSIADAAKVRVTNLTATSPGNIKEENNTYQVTTFTVTVEGLSPDVIFKSPGDDTSYLDAVVNNILVFTNEIAASPDFDTAVIQSVDITESTPMTAADIQGLIDGINNKIASEIQDQISALTAQIQTDNVDTLTQAQIDALIKTETAGLVAKTLTAKTADEIKVMVDEASIKRPSAVITIVIWTYKGA